MEEEQLAELFKLTIDAHKEYVENEFEGEEDQDWADWYADFLLNHDLETLLHHVPDMDDLAEIIEEAFESYGQTESPLGLAEFYAQYLIHNFKTV